MSDTTICGECFERSDESDCVESPRLSYTADEVTEMILERDRLRQFLADIRRADAMVVVTRGAAEVRRIIRALDAE